MAETKKTEENKPAAQQRIRIRLNSYDYRLIDQSTVKIIDTAKRTGALIAGPVLLPTRIRKYTVNRSVHVDKKSREQFEMRIHKRLIEVSGPTQRFIEAMRDLTLPTGVEIEVKTS